MREKISYYGHALSPLIWERLGLPGTVDEQRLPGDVLWGGYPGALPVTKAAPLFPRIR